MINGDDVIRYIRRIASPVFGHTPQDVAEIVVDRATHSLKFHSNGTKEVADLSSTQTLVGKTLTSPTLTAPTLTGVGTTSGSMAFSGAMTGQRRQSVLTAGATSAPATSSSGRVSICTASSGTQVTTLPAASTMGVYFTLICAHADGEIHVAVAAGDNIIGKVSADAGAAGLITTTTTGLLKNTEATNVVGDHVTLVSDGATSWYIISQSGIWSAT